MNKRSDKTRALIQQSALQMGQARSDDVEQRVRAVMATIEKEMADNDGIYPHNKGALSKAEVARRADIHPTTFHTEKQRKLGGEVQTWLDDLKEKKVVGRGSVRRELADRVADWKQQYEGLQQSHRDTELELQQVQADLQTLQKEMEKLQREHERVLKQLAAAAGEKVVPLRGKKG